MRAVIAIPTRKLGVVTLRPAPPDADRRELLQPRTPMSTLHKKVVKSLIFPVAVTHTPQVSSIGRIPLTLLASSSPQRTAKVTPGITTTTAAAIRRILGTTETPSQIRTANLVVDRGTAAFSSFLRQRKRFHHRCQYCRQQWQQLTPTQETDRFQHQQFQKHLHDSQCLLQPQRQRRDQQIHRENDVYASSCFSCICCGCLGLFYTKSLIGNQNPTHSCGSSAYHLAALFMRLCTATFKHRRRIQAPQLPSLFPPQQLYQQKLPQEHQEQQYLLEEERLMQEGEAPAGHFEDGDAGSWKAFHGNSTVTENASLEDFNNPVHAPGEKHLSISSNSADLQRGTWSPGSVILTGEATGASAVDKEAISSSRPASAAPPSSGPCLHPSPPVAAAASVSPSWCYAAPADSAGSWEETDNADNKQKMQFLDKQEEDLYLQNVHQEKKSHDVLLSSWQQIHQQQQTPLRQEEHPMTQANVEMSERDTAIQKGHFSYTSTSSLMPLRQSSQLPQEKQQLVEERRETAFLEAPGKEPIAMREERRQEEQLAFKRKKRQHPTQEHHEGTVQFEKSSTEDCRRTTSEILRDAQHSRRQQQQTAASPSGEGDMSRETVTSRQAGGRESLEQLLSAALEAAAEFESVKTRGEKAAIFSTREKRRLQSDLLKLHEAIATHLHVANSEQLSEIRGHVESLLFRQKLFSHHQLLLRLIEEMYQREIVAGVSTSTLVRYFRDLCNASAFNVAVPLPLLQRLHATLMERQKEMIEKPELVNALVLFLYNSTLLRLPTKDLFTNWARLLLAQTKSKVKLRVSPPLIVFVSRILVAERCGLPELWHVVLEMTMAVDPRTSAERVSPARTGERLNLLSSSSEERNAANRDFRMHWECPRHSAEAEWNQTSAVGDFSLARRRAVGSAGPAGAAVEDAVESTRVCGSKEQYGTVGAAEEVQWLGNLMRTISGAADFCVPRHPAVDVAFERVAEVSAAPRSDSYKLLFCCRAERHSIRLLHFLWSLCVYNLHSRPKFLSIVEACCVHGRLEYAAQCLLNFRSPAFIPFQTADGIMRGRGGDKQSEADALSPHCRHLLQTILMGVKPSCSTWSSNFLSPHPLFLRDFVTVLDEERIQHHFVSREGVSFLHILRIEEEWVEERHIGVVLIDSARQPRDCDRQVLPRTCMGGHVMHNRLLNRQGWHTEVVFQNEWDSFTLLRKRTCVQDLKEKFLKLVAPMDWKFSSSAS